MKSEDHGAETDATETEGDIKMSNEMQEMDPMGTKPVEQHKWLENLLGEWKTETEFRRGPDSPVETAHGTESVQSLGGLWALGEGRGPMPDGTQSRTYYAIGWDVSFNEYRGCWFGSMSSHLWKYTGQLSEDGKTMTLSCEGPSFTKDGETANYKDIIQLVDENYRTLTSYGQDDDGNWQEWMKMHVRRA